MTAERLRLLTACLYDGWGPGFHPDELAEFLAEVAAAMDAPMEVFSLDALPRKSGEGVIKLRGPADNVVKNARRGTLYRQVALVVVGPEPVTPADPDLPLGWPFGDKA